MADATALPAAGTAAGAGVAAAIAAAAVATPGVGTAAGAGIAGTVTVAVAATPGPGAASGEGMAPGASVTVAAATGLGSAAGDGKAPSAKVGPIGYYHASWGYWEAWTPPDAAAIAAYPPGYAEVPLRPSTDYSWDGSNWVYAPAPAAAPGRITFLQCILGFKKSTLISEAEAEDWAARSALPALVLAVIAMLDPAEQSDMRITCLAMTEVERTHPLITQLAEIVWPEMTPEERDAEVRGLFIFWATL